MLENLGTIENRVYRAYWNDGLLDMFGAIGILAIGVSWTFDFVVGGALAPALLVPLWGPFRQKFVERTKLYKIGDKLDETTDMGPMITEGEAKRVEEWVKEAQGMGASVLCGGGRDKALMEPTVLENVPEDATIHKDEVFGPTVNLYPVETFDEALQKANSLPFGLHAAVFTKDVNLAFKFAYELDCGGVMINDSTDYRLDSMPFGGTQKSGLGREGIKFSLQEMTEPKTVCFHIE